MTLSWTALVLLCLAAGLAWFWQDSLRARERANAAALDACEQLHLQFLDGTVAFARMSFVRDVGRLRIKRTYVFDYTANSIERRQGFVVLTGARVETVGYSGDSSDAAVPLRPSPTRTPGKVLHLEDWRATSQEPGSSTQDGRPKSPSGDQ